MSVPTRCVSDVSEAGELHRLVMMWTGPGPRVRVRTAPRKPPLPTLQSYVACKMVLPEQVKIPPLFLSPAWLQVSKGDGALLLAQVAKSGPPLLKIQLAETRTNGASAFRSVVVTPLGFLVPTPQVRVLLDLVPLMVAQVV